MSLINDYLKKTQKEAPPSDKPGDVPPLLKSSQKGRRASFALRLTGFIIVGVIAAAVYFAFQFSNNKTRPPRELVAPNTGFDQQTPVQEKTPEVISRVRKDTEKYRESPKKLVSAANAPAPLAGKVTGKKSLSEEEKAVPALDRKASFEKSPPSSETPASSSNDQVPPPVKITSFKGSTKSKTIDVDIGHYYQIGLMAQRDGDFLEAERFYRKVLEKNPSHIKALINLSAVYILQGKLTEAEKATRKILRIDPKNSKALVNLGIINLKSYQYEPAKRHFQEALRISPREETALINLAFLSKQESDTPLMEKYYNEILNISPDNYEVLLAYASLLEKTNRFAEALSYYQKSLDLDEIKKNERLSGQIKDRINLLRYYYRQEKSKAVN